jgi:CO/xanthine dehydrogenase Mo-binding subunit
VVRPPRYHGILAKADIAGAKRLPGVIAVLRDGSFLGVIAAREEQAVRASDHLKRSAKWIGGDDLPDHRKLFDDLVNADSRDQAVSLQKAPPPAGIARVFEATYTKPYTAHAAMAPSCALAQFDNARLTVWTHSQGVFALKRDLADALKLDTGAVHCIHAEGAGCYGHNGADDAAADAAIVAMQKPGRPVRVRWRREEEFAYEPKASAMVVKVRALVGDDGKPSDWTAEIWSGTHQGRPGGGSPLLGGEALPDPLPLPPPSDVPEANGGGATRNAEPLYDISAKRIIHHLVPETPVRVSSLRGLGAMANVFALECCIDELAARAGQDPVEYRLSITSDPRARAVIEKAAAMANWDPKAPGGTGRGRGIAVARYKNKAGYAAVVVELDVDEEIRLSHVWCAADAGLVVNPDGALNQIEGGIIQSASWVLKEQVRFGNSEQDSGVTSIDWDSYPVLKFSEVPEIDIELLNTKDEVPLGIGEVSAGPTAAAIGNAVSHALGARIRDLPLTRERIMAALLKA